MRASCDRQWWTGETKLTTDSAGLARFRGCLGEYELQVHGHERSFDVPTAGNATVAVKA